MATDIALRTSAVDPEIVAAMQIVDRMSPLKDALGIKDLTDQEIQLFAMVARRSGLDPFAKQLYAIKRKGKVSYQVGIDGYRSIAARTGEYAGSDEAAYEICTCKEKPDGHPSVARVTVRRIHSSGRVIEQAGVARWHELKPAAGEYGADARWIQMPFNQLAKCAEANGLRKLFPTVLADIYIEDEMAQAGPPENGALVAAAGRPSAGERIAARRAAIEAQTEAVVIEGTVAVLDDLPGVETDDPGPIEAQGSTETDDPGPVPPTSTTPAPAAAAPAAARQAAESRGLSFDAFNGGIRSLGATPEELVEACRELYPEAKRISALTGEQRDRLLVRTAELVEARQAAAASA